MTVKSLPPIDENRLRDMRAMGLTTKEISEEFGISTHKVRDLCMAIGIPSPRRNGGAMNWDDDARCCTWRLLRAIRKAHPERFGSVVG